MYWYKAVASPAWCWSASACAQAFLTGSLHALQGVVSCALASGSELGLHQETVVFRFHSGNGHHHQHHSPQHQKQPPKQPEQLQQHVPSPQIELEEDLTHRQPQQESQQKSKAHHYPAGLKHQSQQKKQKQEEVNCLEEQQQQQQAGQEPPGPPDGNNDNPLDPYTLAPAISKCWSVEELQQVHEQRSEQFNAVHCSAFLVKLAHIAAAPASNTSSSLGPARAPTGSSSSRSSVVVGLAQKVAGALMPLLPSCYRARQFANATWALARLQVAPPLGYLEQVEELLVEKSGKRLNKAPPQEIANLVWAFGQLGLAADSRLWEQLLVRAAEGMEGFKLQEVACLMCGVALRQQGVVAAASPLHQQYQQYHQQQQNQQQQQQGWQQQGQEQREAYASHLLQLQQEDRRRSHAFATPSSPLSSSRGPSSGSSSSTWAGQHVGASAQFQQQQQQSTAMSKLLPKVGSYIRQRASRLGSRELSNVLWAYAVLGHRDVAVLSAVADQLQHKVLQQQRQQQQERRPKQGGQWQQQREAAGPDQEQQQEQQGLWRKQGASAAAAADVSNAVWALGKLQVSHQGLVSAVEASRGFWLAGASHGELAVTLWGLEAMGAEAGVLLQEGWQRAVEVLPQLSATDAATLADAAGGVCERHHVSIYQQRQQRRRRGWNNNLPAGEQQQQSRVRLSRGQLFNTAMEPLRGDAVSLEAAGSSSRGETGEDGGDAAFGNGSSSSSGLSPSLSGGRGVTSVPVAVGMAVEFLQALQQQCSSSSTSTTASSSGKGATTTSSSGIARGSSSSVYAVLPPWSAREHVQVLRAYILARVPLSTPMRNALFSSLEKALPSCLPNQMTITAWALAKLRPETPTPLVDLLAQQAAARIWQFKPHELSVLAWAFGRLLHTDALLFDCIAMAVVPVVSRLTPQSVANLTWAYGRVCHYNSALLTALAQRAAAVLPQFKPAELACMVWGLASLRYKQRSLLELVEEHVVANCSNWNSKSLARLAVAYAMVDSAQPVLFQTLGDVLASRPRCLSGLTPHELAELGWGYAVQRQRHQGLCRALAAEGARRGQQLCLKDLVQLVWALVVLRQPCRGLLDAAAEVLMEGEAEKKLQQLQPGQWLQLAWAFGRQRHPAAAWVLERARQQEPVQEDEEQQQLLWPSAEQQWQQQSGWREEQAGGGVLRRRLACSVPQVMGEGLERVEDWADEQGLEKDDRYSGHQEAARSSYHHHQQQRQQDQERQQEQRQDQVHWQGGVKPVEAAGNSHGGGYRNNLGTYTSSKLAARPVHVQQRVFVQQTQDQGEQQGGQRGDVDEGSSSGVMGIGHTNTRQQQQQNEEEEFELLSSPGSSSTAHDDALMQQQLPALAAVSSYGQLSIPWEGVAVAAVGEPAPLRRVVRPTTRGSSSCLPVMVQQQQHCAVGRLQVMSSGSQAAVCRDFGHPS